MSRITNDATGDVEERAFQLISGHRALDFLATCRDRHRAPVECLRGPADLDLWLACAGLAATERATDTDLRAARRLRETINRLVRSALANELPDADDVRELNAWARRPQLVAQTDRSLQLHWSAERPIEAALAVIAHEVVELLTGAERSRIRECAAAPNCSRLYVDNSRAGSRRWCHMQWCGSRSKMSAYRRRRGSAAQPAQKRA